MIGNFECKLPTLGAIVDGDSPESHSFCELDTEVADTTYSYDSDCLAILYSWSQFP
jgi:hypothetical protein